MPKEGKSGSRRRYLKRDVIKVNPAGDGCVVLADVLYYS